MTDIVGTLHVVYYECVYNFMYIGSCHLFLHHHYLMSYDGEESEGTFFFMMNGHSIEVNVFGS